MHSALGRGISLRRSFLRELAERLVKEDPAVKSQLDWVELVPENVIGRGGEIRRALRQISECLPVALHGVTLSIGSADPLDWSYLRELKKLCRELRVTWATDHISYASVDGVHLHNLLPLPLTHEALAHTIERVKQVQDFLEIPFGLENPSYYTIPPGCEMDEAEFIVRLLEESGCFLLLDLNNVYVNSYNQVARECVISDLSAGLDPSELVSEATRLAKAFIAKIPGDRVMEIHVAGHDQVQVGHKRLPKRLIDTHGAPVSDPVLTLVADFHKKHSLGTLLLEREREVPPLDEVICELNQIWFGAVVGIGGEVSPFRGLPKGFDFKESFC